MPEWLTYVLVIGANLTFVFGTMVFSHYSKTISVAWVNTMKAIIAGLLFLLFILIKLEFKIPHLNQLSYLLASGFLGLCLADLLLLKAFTILGPGRTLVLFSFQPLILGTAGYFLFHQTFSPWRLVSIVFMLACLLVFISERKEQTGKWSMTGFLEAFFAVLLDAVGIILTRLAYENGAELHPMETNFFRCFGALFGFFLYNFIRPINLSSHFLKLSHKQKMVLVLGCTIGTFVSLSLYLTAIKYAHLASISALSITGPILASLLECLIHKTRPSKHLLLALLFFIAGVVSLTLL